MSECNHQRVKREDVGVRCTACGRHFQTKAEWHAAFKAEDSP